MTRAAAAAAFEAAVAHRSARASDDSRFAVGYYVSLPLLCALNAALPAPQQVAAATLTSLVLVKGNARVFSRSSLALHARVDAVILAESDRQNPVRLRREERARVEQVAKHARDPAFCAHVRRARNGTELLARLQQALEAAIARYCIECRGWEDSGETPEATLLTNVSLSTIRCESSVARAYAIQQRQPDRFTAYCAFFKNDNLLLATQISRKCKDKCRKREIREWIKETIGSIPAFVPTATQRAKRQTQFRNSELRQLAIAAAALTVYGEHVLSALYDSSTSSMHVLQDIPLVSEEIRDARKQRECLQRARWTNKRRSNASRIAHLGEMHAAHYLPLDLSIQWNNALPPEQRLSTTALSWILNHPSNMKAVPRSVNTKDHRQVEHFIAAFLEENHRDDVPRLPKATRKSTTWLVWRNIHDRLAQIAARVQSRELRGAFVRAKSGEALYDLVEQTFRRIETEFVVRGYAFGPIWDCKERHLVRRDSSAVKPREFAACIIAQSWRARWADTREELQSTRDILQSSM